MQSTPLQYLICSDFTTSGRAIRLPVQMATLNSYSRGLRTYRHTIESAHELVFENLDTGKVETEYLNGSYKVYLREGKPLLDANYNDTDMGVVITDIMYDYVHCMTGRGPQEFDFRLDKRSDIHRRRAITLLCQNETE